MGLDDTCTTFADPCVQIALHILLCMHTTAAVTQFVCSWNEVFDFVEVPVHAVLLVTVWDQTTVMDAAASLSTIRVCVLPAQAAHAFYASEKEEHAMMRRCMLVQITPVQYSV